MHDFSLKCELFAELVMHSILNAMIMSRLSSLHPLLSFLQFLSVFLWNCSRVLVRRSTLLVISIVIMRRFSGFHSLLSFFKFLSIFLRDRCWCLVRRFHRFRISVFSTCFSLLSLFLLHLSFLPHDLVHHIELFNNFIR